MELVINPPQQVFDQLINLSGELNGWAHQPYDYRFYSENFDEYWFIAVVDKEKKPHENFVAGGCLARWDAENEASLYSIGLYYCKEEYRGKGHGLPVFKAMMGIVGDGNCVLTAAVDMSEKYATTFGFKEMLPFWHMEAEIEPGKMRISADLTEKYVTKDWKEVGEAQLEAYDLTICTRNRKKLMRNWFQQDQVYTRIAFDSNQKIVGYCTIRVVNLNRLCAAPFYAENVEVAEVLMADMMKSIPDFASFEKLIFWYPDVNKDVERLLQKLLPSDGYHIKKDFRTQFTKNVIKARDGVVYSVACSTHQFV
ncbi:YitH/HolE acetyltransferase (GNAT) domain-containing protein [Caenorhabditis elegans]|uniref:YitH/HolE acetyltransferase (GNAT) domain-containing protein n=1 Tax=Caenorhabditis elegans TaxID=6239 RepID=O46009_CAEEL|nr:YitH/HolE acetyltransferase (GNAT) domain-containing protein [Caenorhabditis elegans]CAB04995.2 YitH/HolE acetyltransferase (GNAT) domain-containing protein [Caenorhabditis elegans]|eukprot:NP_507614.1 Uncharacterized protein CELE_ZK228.3 [Caenorhabditis elegans]